MILDAQPGDRRCPPPVRRQGERHFEGWRPGRSDPRQSRRRQLAGGGGADMFRYDSTAESNSASSGPDPRLHARHRQDRPQPDRRPDQPRRRRPGLRLDRLQRVQRRRPASFAPSSRAAPGSSRATPTATASPTSSSPHPAGADSARSGGLPALVGPLQAPSFGHCLRPIREQPDRQRRLRARGTPSARQALRSRPGRVVCAQ